MDESDNKLREALAEIAGIASQRGTDKQMFSMEDYRRLGEIERLARRVLHETDPDEKLPQQGSD